jgi:hypothetical protein
MGILLSKIQSGKKNADKILNLECSRDLGKLAGKILEENYYNIINFNKLIEIVLDTLSILPYGNYYEIGNYSCQLRSLDGKISKNGNLPYYCGNLDTSIWYNIILKLCIIYSKAFPKYNFNIKTALGWAQYKDIMDNLFNKIDLSTEDCYIISDIIGPLSKHMTHNDNLIQLLNKNKMLTQNDKDYIQYLNNKLWKISNRIEEEETFLYLIDSIYICLQEVLKIFNKNKKLKGTLKKIMDNYDVLKNRGPQVIGCWKDSCVQKTNKTKKIEFGKKRGIYYYNKFGNKQYIK